MKPCIEIIGNRPKNMALVVALVVEGRVGCRNIPAVQVLVPTDRGC